MPPHTAKGPRAPTAVRSRGAHTLNPVHTRHRHNCWLPLSSPSLLHSHAGVRGCAQHPPLSCLLRAPLTSPIPPPPPAGPALPAHLSAILGACLAASSTADEESLLGTAAQAAALQACLASGDDGAHLVVQVRGCERLLGGGGGEGQGCWWRRLGRP